MSAEEFIEQYGRLELLKMMKAEEKKAHDEDAMSANSGGLRATSGGRSSNAGRDF